MHARPTRASREPSRRPELTGFVERLPLDGTAVLDSWRALTRRAPPVLSADYFLATARWLVRERPLLAGARAGGELACALPLLERGVDLFALGTEHNPRYDLAGAPEGLPALWRSLCRRRGWHRLTLSRVPEGSPLLTDLVDLARRDRCRVVVQPRSRSPYVALDRSGEQLRGRFRRELRRRARRLGELDFERITRFDERALEEALALEAASWKGQAGTAITCDRRTHSFYVELAQRFAGLGQLDLCFLVSGGRRIAAHFALEDDRAYYLLKPGYDPDFARFSPGQLLVQQVAADARGRGLAELDFLGTDMSWKLEWTDLLRAHSTIRIYRPTAPGLLLYALEQKARPALGQLKRMSRGTPRSSARHATRR